MDSKWKKTISDNLLGYGYKVFGDKEDDLTMQAGNGSMVTFKKVGSNPVKVCLLAAGSEWAIRQVADIFYGNPCFSLEPNTEVKEEGCSPWTIVFKKQELESKEFVRGLLIKG